MNYWGEIATGLITALTTYFVTMKRTKAEIRGIEAEASGSELDSVEKAIEIWRKLAEEMTDKMTEQRNEMEKQMDILRDKIAELEAENKKLKRELSALRRNRQ